MPLTSSIHARAAGRALLAAALLVGLGACSSFNDTTRGMADALTLYKPEVVQGNFVSKEQVAELQPGMTRVQVRDLLGTPLMTSLFHGDRWDYVFDCGPSMTSAVTSSPRCAGRQCMNRASGLAARIISRSTHQSAKAFLRASFSAS